MGHKKYRETDWSNQPVSGFWVVVVIRDDARRAPKSYHGDAQLAKAAVERIKPGYSETRHVAIEIRDVETLTTLERWECEGDWNWRRTAWTDREDFADAPIAKDPLASIVHYGAMSPLCGTSDFRRGTIHEHEVNCGACLEALKNSD